MALVIVSGLACSGRTGRSRELVRDFEQRRGDELPGMRVLHLRNKDANIHQSQFATQLAEKPARSAYLSLIMRNLSKSTIVIADGGAGTNIKGFRYQLWCAAREIGVRCVSVLCVSTPDVCKQRNAARAMRRGEGGANGEREVDEEPYDDDTLSELLMRFEEPNPMTRWDSPLFVIDCNPSARADEVGEADGKEWETAPFDAIWDAITKGKVTKAPDVVAPTRGTTSNYLSLLESSTQLVLASFQALSSFSTVSDTGGTVQLSLSLPNNPSNVQLPLSLPMGKKAPTTAALQRHRRQFVKMHAAGAAAGNELGHVLEQEGRPGGPPSSSSHNRAERKGQQNSSSAGRVGREKQTSPEEEIARRFIAYLEEAL